MCFGQWVVEGYQTMLDEADAQVPAMTGGRQATHIIVPLGCGSVAQAVTQHYKSAVRQQGAGVTAAAVMAVEPTTAACFRASLERGTMTVVPTGDTIMCGMNCGTVSTTAWPVLRAGADASVVVTDLDAYQAVQELGKQHALEAGPCGAATLAALRHICAAQKRALGLDENSVVVLFCTEGPRDVAVPSS